MSFLSLSQKNPWAPRSRLGSVCNCGVDSMAPAGDLFGALVGGHGGLHDAAGAVDVDDVARLHAQRNAAGPGRAQTAHLVVARNADGRADQVALKLHQVRVARGTAVNTKLGQRRA